MTQVDSWIVDVEAKSFEKSVIERSLKCPVVLYFWASWCEPCKELGPLLETRARSGAGRFLLAKVDTDANPELSQALRVQGVPAVIVLSGGQLVDGFEGGLPEAELDAFLDRVAPPGTGMKDTPESIGEQARALAEEGKGSEAITLLREHLRGAPEEHGLRLVLADLLVDEGKPQEARLVFDKLPEEQRDAPPGKALAARIEFAEEAGDLEALRQAAQENPGDFEARKSLGRALLATKDLEGGLEELLEAVRVAPDGRAQEASALMLETFDVLGLEDAIANDFRFRLSLELFA